jgi:hypothetical protein
MESEVSSETFELVHETTRRHIPEERSLNTYEFFARCNLYKINYNYPLSAFWYTN